jgi:hypothetical protein
MRPALLPADPVTMLQLSLSDTWTRAMLGAALDSRPIYTIDADDRIASVNEAWLQFTQSGAEPIASADNVVGRSIWEMIAGGEVRQLWELLYARVRGVRGQVFVPVRADTPQQRRLIDIELRPLADRAIQHICEPVWSEARAPVRLLDPASVRDQRSLRCCVWCSRIEVKRGFWEEAEDAQSLLGSEQERTLPTLQSAACVTCKQSILQTFPMAVGRPSP